MGAVMPVATADGDRVWQRRTALAQWGVWLGWLALVALFVLCWQVMNKNTIWLFVEDAPRQAADLLSRAWPPRWSYLDRLWGPLWDTINIATLGTLLGIVLATPVAFLAARNTTPSALVLRPLALLIIVASRSINSLIWALLLVAIIGPGLLAGIIAIGFRSIGFIGKLLYEAIEEIDEDQVEAVSATGASGAPGDELRGGAADHAGLRRDRRVPLGYQHPGIDHSRPRGRRRHRAPAPILPRPARLGGGHRHLHRHPRDGRRFRMGFRQGPRRDHLISGQPLKKPKARAS